MTPTPDPRSADRLGFVLAFAGLALGFWSKATNTLTLPMYVASAVLIGAGMFFVDSSRATGFFREARDTAERFAPGIAVHAEQAGRRDTDATVLTTAVTPVPAPPAPVDRLAYDTADSIRLTPRADPPRETPTLRMTIPDAPAPVRRRRRATDPAPVLVPPTEVQPQSESPLDGVNREDG